MQWIISLIIGGVVGWLASMVMGTNAQMGAIANVIVGITGSMLGFWIAGLIGLTASGAIGGWLVSVGGAAILLAILKAVGVFK